MFSVLCFYSDLVPEYWSLPVIINILSLRDPGRFMGVPTVNKSPHLFFPFSIGVYYLFFYFRYVIFTVVQGYFTPFFNSSSAWRVLFNPVLLRRLKVPGLSPHSLPAPGHY